MREYRSIGLSKSLISVNYDMGCLVCINDITFRQIECVGSLIQQHIL